MADNDLPISLEQNDLLRLFRWHRLDPSTAAGCEVVAAGSFVVKDSSAGFLTASLGSAVGLALYDRSAGVGGIASFLLARPAGGESLERPEKYVESGLPLFIAALRAAGADPERFEAAVAGGALQLMGAGTEADFKWCGLATDSLLEQLNRRQIPVAAVEVGGIRPLSLLLNTRSWKASIELMEDHAPPSVSKIREPTKGQIDHAIATIQPIPQIALKILAFLEAGHSLASLVKQIKQDQVVAAKVLRFSNSPLYNSGKEVTSIDRALVFLGENSLAEIAIAAAVSTSFGEPGAGYGLMRGGLYKHALAVAHVSKTLAIDTGLVDPGVAYTAGLLHDIGKIVLDRFVANALPFFYQYVPGGNKDYAELERELFATDHLEVGQRLAQQWRLSRVLTEVIAHHHWPERAATEHQPLVHLIYLADLLSSCYLTGVEMESINTLGLKERLKLIGLQPETLPEIIERVSWKNLMYL
jgi:putative nucleotidyltransferase with HDIG domain